MFLGIVTLLTALCISGIAAYYSITGLTAIFAAAAIPVIIMGSILELSKIVGCVWLHYNWERAPWKIKSYLIFAVGALMIITSLGIFGFLSRAHLDQAVPSGDIQAQVALFDEKIKTQRDNIEADKRALAQLDVAVDQIMARSDSEQGATRSAKLRQSQKKDRMQYQNNIDQAQKEITKLQNERAPIASQLRKVESDVGPIRYLATMIYGDNPDQNLLEAAVRWVIILIVAVFDPLAIVLILAATTSIDWARKEKQNKSVATVHSTNDIQYHTVNTTNDDLIPSEPKQNEIVTTANTLPIIDEELVELRKKYDQLIEHNIVVTSDFENLKNEKHAADELISKLREINAEQKTDTDALIQDYELAVENNKTEIQTLEHIVAEQQSNFNVEKVLHLQKIQSSELLATELIKANEKYEQLTHDFEIKINELIEKEKEVQLANSNNERVIASLSSELEILKNKYDVENKAVNILQNEMVRIVAEKDNEITLLKDNIGQQMANMYEQDQANKTLQTQHDELTQLVKQKDNEINSLKDNIGQQTHEHQSLLNQYNELTQLFKIKIDDFNLLQQQVDQQSVSTNEIERKYAQVIDEIIKKSEQIEKDAFSKVEFAQMQNFASEKRELQKIEEIKQLQKNINTLATENATLKDALITKQNEPADQVIEDETSKVNIQFQPKTSGPLVPVRPSAIALPTATIVTDSFPIGGNISFGTAFPDNAARGDLFLKIDTVPSKLVKWSGSRWIELDKSKTDVYVYNNEYMSWLVNQVQNGLYDVDYLTESEKDQIKLILEKR